MTKHAILIGHPTVVNMSTEVSAFLMPNCGRQGAVETSTIGCLRAIQYCGMQAPRLSLSALPLATNTCNMDTSFLKKEIPFQWSFRHSVYVLLGILFLYIISGGSSAPAPAVQQSVAQSQSKQITYQIVDRWTIPNGGEGKVIVISLDLLNETDMVVLGNKIKNDTQSDRNANISVFDNASAAALRDKVLSDKATTAEQDLYDKHFVGQYTKNGNTGFNEFVIYFDGVMGTNQKTIKY